MTTHNIPYMTFKSTIVTLELHLRSSFAWVVESTVKYASTVKYGNLIFYQYCFS